MYAELMNHISDFAYADKKIICIYYEFINLEIMHRIFFTEIDALISPECLRIGGLQSLVSELSMSLGLTCTH